MATNFARVLALAVCAIVPSLAIAQKAVILVRHAERDPKAADGISDAGRERAKSLARALKDAGVTHIVRSDTLRTKQTAEPTLKQGEIKEAVVKADASHVDGAAKAIQGAGETAVVLYVGHSDTIEPLLRRLRYKGPVSFDDPFGNLIILMPKGDSPVVVRLHY